MNILFLALDIDLRVHRGDTIHTRELARALGRRGNRVDLVTATPKGSDPDLGPSVFLHTRPKASDFGIVRRCTRIAGWGQAVIVYERRLSPKISFGVSRLRGIPFVVEVNGVEEEASMQGRPNVSPLRHFKAAIRRRMLRSAASVVAVSEGLARLVREGAEIDPSRVVAISNGVDADLFMPVEPKSARAALRLRERPWIVFVGNFVPWQGIETAVRAMPLVWEFHPDASLLLVGDGISRPSVEDCIQSLGRTGSVVSAGLVPYEQVPQYICAADVCIAPFTSERNQAIGLSPLKVYEYMSCERPVVASDVPGVRETVSASGAGLLVPPDDPAALSAAVSNLLEHPAEARRMGERGRDYVLSEATWARTAERIEDVLTRAVARKHAASASS